MSATRADSRVAVRGDLLDFVSEPGWGEVDSAAVRFRPDHWLLIEGGRIHGVQAAAPDAQWQRQDHCGRLILPGFIDSHVHMPQLDMIASYGTELLAWLNTYAFPAETRFADPERSHQGAELFANALLANGTTTAVVFPTAHKVSVDALFGAAQRRGMRLVTGKVLQDRHSPDGLMAAHPGLYMQTHVAENRDEVRWVRELFPDARSYLDVYAGPGLLHPRSVLAHGVWINDADRAALCESGAQIAHSPSSNLFLGSGLFDWAAAVQAGAAVSLASDVGGGTSLSMLKTMAEAYKVQALAGQRLTAWKALHAATLGSARALQLDAEIGSFDPGRMADFCVWDWATGAVDTQRQQLARDLHEKVFAWMLLSDERHLASTWVAGRQLYARKPTP